MDELKTYRGFMCDDNEEWCKIEDLKKYCFIVLSIQNWHEECDEFWSEHSKILKICN